MGVVLVHVSKVNILLLKAEYAKINSALKMTAVSLTAGFSTLQKYFTAKQVFNRTKNFTKKKFVNVATNRLYY